MSRQPENDATVQGEETKSTDVDANDSAANAEQKNQAEKPLSVPLRLLLAFSVYTNGRKILDTRVSDATLTSLHGIRFFTMVWIIQGHTFFWIEISQNWANRIDVLTSLGSPYYLWIISGNLSVDTFFLLSGTLLGYLFFPEMKRRGGPRKINWLYYFFHRWWRLTPTLWLVMFTYIYLYPLFYNGPRYSHEIGGPHSESCFRNIWANLLYLNNYIEACMGWSWYLACEWQFYCGAPIIFLCFHRSWKLGLASIITSVLLQIASILVIIILSRHDTSYYGGMYHFGVYALGLGLGYLLRKYKGKKIRISRGKQALAWLLMIFLWFPIWGPWQNMAPGNLFLTAGIIAVKRWWWALGVAWIIFACTNGYGGFINKLLSWRALIPLSRLTYCAYLVHPVLMYVFEQGRRTLFYGTDISLHYLITGHLFNSYILAFFVSLAFEAPMIALDKEFFKCGGRSKCRKGQTDAGTAGVKTGEGGEINAGFVEAKDVNDCEGEIKT